MCRRWERVEKSVAQNRKKKISKRNRYIGIAVCGAIVATFLCTLISQQITLASIRREREDCVKQIALREEEFARLKEKAEYSSTDEYYEEKARDEGYVRDDETVFIVGN